MQVLEKSLAARMIALWIKGTGISGQFATMSATIHSGLAVRITSFHRGQVKEGRSVLLSFCIRGGSVDTVGLE